MMFYKRLPIINKTVWITGASSGLGYELALQLAQAGNFVIASARNQDKLTQLVNRCPKRIVALPVDVSDAGSRCSVSQQLGEITDSVDVLIMSAGMVAYEDNMLLSDVIYKEVFGVNFFGLINTLAIARPFLEKAQQRAYVVGISSLSMMIGFPRAQAYGSSKAAADYFLHSLCVDLPKRKYDVSIVRPGFVATPMTADNDFPMPFLMSPEKAATRIIHGMEKRQRVIAFPRRLSFLIRFVSWFPWLWYGLIGPKVSRNEL